jgi:hypothetical protein
MLTESPLFYIIFFLTELQDVTFQTSTRLLNKLNTGSLDSDNFHTHCRNYITNIVIEIIDRRNFLIIDSSNSRQGVQPCLVYTRSPGTRREPLKRIAFIFCLVNAARPATLAVDNGAASLYGVIENLITWRGGDFVSS